VRQDNLAFTAELQQQDKEPRFVVGLVYPTGSPYFSSHAGLSNVPGVEIANTLQNIAGTSQEINPDEARATIGAISFDVVDVAGAVTTELRDQLTDNDRQPRRIEARFFMGFTDDFNDFVRIATQQVENVSLNDVTYSIQCADIQRQLRESVFDFKTTRLNAALTDVATSMTVLDASAFETVVHTAAFTDAPSTAVGYLKVKKTGEVIRFTGKSGSPEVTFTGLTRGVLGTTAAPVDIKAGTDTDKLPEIQEYIYLEMPGPEIQYAVLTGVIRSSTASPQDTLPSHWHRGVAEASVDGAQFDGIGLDLVDPAVATTGMVFRFQGLKKIDGKRFIETELGLPMGTYMPIDVFGVLGLRRISAILTDAPQLVDLDETNVVSTSTLVHDQKSVINQVQFDWNFDGKDYTRRNLFIDAGSISRNGDATLKRLKFQGIVGSNHTDRTLRAIARGLYDRFGEPPVRIDVTVLPSFSMIEVGDVVRLTLARVRDYQGSATLDRSFEVQQAAIDWRTGNVNLTLFGTGRETPAEPPSGAAVPLPDNWYTGAGTNLTSPLTIVADAVTANGTLTGNADMNNAGAIFYYDGDLTINAGVVVTISANVQLRIKGTLTVNGQIDGAANGLTGTASPNVVSSPIEDDVSLYQGTPGWLGSNRGGDSMRYDPPWYWNRHQHYPSRGVHNTTPVLNLEVTGADSSPPAATLHGIPTDLRGTSGGAGYAIENVSFSVLVDGGDGGDSGAGLVIVSRGLAFGASGDIDLSGENGNNGGGPTSVGGKDMYGGSGAGASPGALYVLLDGDGISLPDLDGKLTNNRGVTPTPGTPGTVQYGYSGNLEFDSLPGMGQFQGMAFDGHVLSAHQIQYIPTQGQLGDTDDEAVPPITGLAISSDSDGVVATWDALPDDSYDVIEIWSSTDNDRSNAVLVWTGTGTKAFIAMQGIFTRWYWCRVIRAALRSLWHPVSSTAGVAATGGTPDIPLISGRTYWETFDGYASRADFEREWEIVSGDPTITFETNGLFGGKAMRVTGEMYAVSRRLLPYDPNRLMFIQVEARRITADAGDENLRAGLVAIAADGTTKINTGGANSFTNPHSLINVDMGTWSLNTFKRLFNWFTDTVNSSSSTSTSVNYSFGAAFIPFQIRSTASLRPSYLRPFIYCNESVTASPPVSTAVCEVDNLLVYPFEAGALMTQIPDPSFAEKDEINWRLGADGSGDPYAEYALGEGENGNAALKVPNISNQSIASFPRQLVARVGDTLNVRMLYKLVDNNSPASINASSLIRVTALGYNPGSTFPARWTLSSEGPSVAKLISTLTVDGAWHETDFAVDISGMTGTDGIAVTITVTSAAAGDDFDCWTSRVTIRQS